MIVNRSFFGAIADLWKHFDLRIKFNFYLVLTFIFVASASEIVSIGMVLPFLSSLTSTNSISEPNVLQNIFKWIELGSNPPVLNYALFFGLSSLLAGFMRLALLYLSCRLTYLVGSSISAKVYKLTLYQPYAVHLNRNSSEVVSSLVIKTNNATSAVGSFLTLISSSIMLIFIVAVIVVMQPKIAILALISFGSTYGLVAIFSRRQISICGAVFSSESSKAIKILNEGLGGIRDVLINGSQEIYCQSFSKSDSLTRRAQGIALFISSNPRYLIEALGMSLIAYLAYSFSQYSNAGSLIPALGFLALGAQRLLPLMQQIYSSWSGIKGNEESLMGVLTLLNQPMPVGFNEETIEAIEFNKNITLRNVSFSYSNSSPLIIDRLNLDIKKGGSLGIVGQTGSGKSTLVDIILGLLYPTSGELLVDETRISPSTVRSWQALIAHVPQSIFLTDSSIMENIAFGVPLHEINTENVRKAAVKAQLSDFIDAQPETYQTLVGERGVRLSGGQRQRIGIARALYKDSKVLILDEATSALDSETEESIIQVINELDLELTVIVIAHRLTTLKNCEKILELGGQGIKVYKSYQEMMKCKT